MLPKISDIVEHRSGMCGRVIDEQGDCVRVNVNGSQHVFLKIECRVVERGGEPVIGIGLRNRELVEERFVIDTWATVQGIFVKIYAIEQFYASCVPGRRVLSASGCFARDFLVDAHKTFPAAYMHALNFIRKFRRDPGKDFQEYNGKEFSIHESPRDLIWLDPDFKPEPQLPRYTLEEIGRALIMTQTYTISDTMQLMQTIEGALKNDRRAADQQRPVQGASPGTGGNDSNHLGRPPV